MKFLVFTDTHASKKAMKRLKEKAKRSKPDAMICAGDITIFDNNLDLVLEEFNEFGIPLYIIPGNHEFEDLFVEMCKNFDNIECIHEAVHIDDDNKIAIIGSGGGGFSLVDKRFEKVAKSLLKKVPRGYKIILVTHAPPYGTNLDKILDEHCGCKSITQFIKQAKRISVALAGHIHECEGNTDKIGKTRLINPGPFGKILRL